MPLSRCCGGLSREGELPRIHPLINLCNAVSLATVREGTASVLIVAEAMHDSAAEDIPELTATIARELAAVWPVTPRTALLSQSSTRFE
jgi:DNA/RNA-binding domain of Phe-tRNA-synthetase-like protein